MVSAKGSLGTFEPLFEHLSNVVGGSFPVLLAPAFTTEDEFREAQEVGPGPDVTVRGDSCQAETGDPLASRGRVSSTRWLATLQRLQCGREDWGSGRQPERLQELSGSPGQLRS